MFFEFMLEETVIGVQNGLSIILFTLKVVIKWVFRDIGIFNNGIDSRRKKTILRQQFKATADQIITSICIGTFCLSRPSPATIFACRDSSPTFY